MSNERPEPQVWVGGVNCNLLVILETGAWIYNGLDVTNSPGSLREVFIEYASTEWKAKQGKPHTRFIMDDRKTALKARNFVSGIVRFADAIDSSAVNNTPKRLYTIHLTPPKL